MLDSGLVNRGFSASTDPLPPDGSRTILADPRSPRQKWALTGESFNRLLLWLDHDRERAAGIYENIRSALINRFLHLGCSEASEGLADITFDRVAQKLEQIIDRYKGKPEPYVFSVAYYVHKEWLRRPILQSLANEDFTDPSGPDTDESLEKELLHACLQQCLNQLDQETRSMIVEYYRGNRQVKIKTRKALAERLGIEIANLRLRAQRIRTGLQRCIIKCMARAAAKREVVM